MKDYLKPLAARFEEAANPQYAVRQAAYMKNHFEFYGIQAPVRKEIKKAFLKKQGLPTVEKLPKILKHKLAVGKPTAFVQRSYPALD